MSVQTSINTPPSSVAPRSEQPGCLSRVFALVLLGVSLSNIMGWGTVIPLGFDETLSTFLMVWSVHTLFGIDLTRFMRKGGARLPAQHTREVQAKVIQHPADAAGNEGGAGQA
jgi:hypothetical protein